MQNQNPSHYNTALKLIQENNFEAGFTTISADAHTEHLNFGHWLTSQQYFADAAHWFKYLITREYPEPKLSYWCGLCFSTIEDFQYAEYWLRHAIVDMGKSELPYIALAQLYQNQNQIDNADLILKKMLAIFPDNTALWIKSGAFFMLSHDYTLAIPYFQHVVSQWPEEAMAFNDLANCHQHLGNFEESQRCFKKALMLDGEIAGAYIGLTSSKKFTDANDPTISFLEQRLANSTSHQTKACIHFAQAKLNDDLKQFEQAWNHIETANQLSLQNSPSWSTSQWQSNIKNIIRLFPISETQQQQSTRRSPIPIFIVGMPRSGTTLLEKLLSKISDVKLAGELDALDTILASLQQPESTNPLIYPTTLAFQQNRKTAQDYFMQQAIKHSKANNDCSFIIDKNPLNFVHLGLISKLFPEAIIIHMQRHPLDVLISNYFQYFAHQNLNYSFSIENIVAFIESYEILINHWRQFFASKQQVFIEYNYEEVVADPEQTLIKLQNLLSGRSLQQESTQDIITTASIWQARQPIYQSSVSRWKNYQQQLKVYSHLIKQWL